MKFKYLLTVLALTIASLGLTGCPSDLNAVARAKTLEQKVYAGYGTATIFAERGAALIVDPTLDDGVKRPVALAIKAFKPVADNVVSTLLEMAVIKAEIQAGATKDEDLLIAATNLNKYYLELQPLVNDLVNSVTVGLRCGKLSSEAFTACAAGGGA